MRPLPGVLFQAVLLSACGRYRIPVQSIDGNLWDRRSFPMPADGELRVASLTEDEALARFFRLRWPDGFRCPACNRSAHSVIATRSLPLYQCKHCRAQTSVTSGTIMHKSRTPLSKWAAAVDALSASAGLSGVKLAALIGVSTKVACAMLNKFREAIGVIERKRKLGGDVRTGLRVMAPNRIFMYAFNRLYKCERVIALSASVDGEGKPYELKLRMVKGRDLEPGTKIATDDGRRRLMEEAARPGANTMWVKETLRFPKELEQCFKEARKWFVDVFRGIGTKYLQRYLDEYCFRWNLAMKGEAPESAWTKLMFP